MPAVETARGLRPFYTGSLGATDGGLPVHGYYDGRQIRLVIVPPDGVPYYAPDGISWRRDAATASPVSWGIAGGAIGLMLGGGLGTLIGGVVGAVAGAIVDQKDA